jgi:TatD DNase family protein
MIFDTHSHCFWNGLELRQDELRRNMQMHNVTRSVQIGTSVETSQEALKLARDWGADTWCTAGIHPSDCQDMSDDSISELMNQLEDLIRANRDKVVAVGETGLDYYHLTRGREKTQTITQKLFFAAQAGLAQKLELPLVIHTRNAAVDTIALMKEFGIKRAVMHCYSEGSSFAQELMDWSSEIYFSFSGVLTYKNAAAVQEAALTLPLNRILVETDAPFLVPQCVRGSFRVNEPAFTKHVMDFLKELRTEPGDIVEQTVWENSNSFFGI